MDQPRQESQVCCLQLLQGRVPVGRANGKIGLKMSGLTPNVRLSPPGLMLKVMEHCTADS